MFSGNSTNNSSGGLFGSSNNNNSSSGGLFGSSNNSSSGGLFGSSTNNSSSGGLFGSNNNNNNSSGGLFGSNSNNSSSGGLFGSSNNNNSSGGLFGSNNNNSSGGLFGSNNNNSSGGLFGNNNNNSSSLFGNNNNNNNSSGLFGNNGNSGSAGDSGDLKVVEKIIQQASKDRDAVKDIIKKIQEQAPSPQEFQKQLNLCNKEAGILLDGVRRGDANAVKFYQHSRDETQIAKNMYNEVQRTSHNNHGRSRFKCPHPYYEKKYQQFRQTLDELHRAGREMEEHLQMLENDNSNTPAALSQALGAQHNTIVCMANRVAAIHTMLEKVKKEYIEQNPQDKSLFKRNAKPPFLASSTTRSNNFSRIGFQKVATEENTQNAITGGTTTTTTTNTTNTTNATKPSTSGFSFGNTNSTTTGTNNNNNTSTTSSGFNFGTSTNTGGTNTTTTSGSTGGLFGSK